MGERATLIVALAFVAQAGLMLVVPSVTIAFALGFLANAISNYLRIRR